MTQTGTNNNTNVAPQTGPNQPDIHHETAKKAVEEGEHRIQHESQSEAHEREETQRNQNSFIFSNNAPQQSKLQLQIYYN